MAPACEEMHHKTHSYMDKDPGHGRAARLPAVSYSIHILCVAYGTPHLPAFTPTCDHSFSDSSAIPSSPELLNGGTTQDSIFYFFSL